MAFVPGTVLDVHIDMSRKRSRAFFKDMHHFGCDVYKTKQLDVSSVRSGDPSVAVPTAEDIATATSAATAASVPEQEGRRRQEEAGLTVPLGEEGEAVSAPGPSVLDLHGTKWVRDYHATSAAIINDPMLFRPCSQT